MSRSQRKWDHITFAVENNQKSSDTFADIQFVHQSLPDSCVDEITIDHRIGELYLSSPIFINAMTGGGGDKTYDINKELATIAKSTGLAMAVGSQMAAIKDEQQKYTYQVVRAENPNGVILANLGSEATVEQAERAVDMLEANALQLHLNVIQELTMPEGDRDFTGALTRIEKIVGALPVPVIVKEVGFGMSSETVASLLSVGVEIVDIGGAGGTNFATIENKRRERELSFFEDWGIPTAAAIVEGVTASPAVSIIGSGGIRSGLDAAKALALGADGVGMAGSFLRILLEKGSEELLREIENIHSELVLVMTALGASTIPQLQQSPLIISGRTYHWLQQRGISTSQYSQRRKS